MKILIVSQYFWPEGFRINDLALGLKERGFDVSVLTGMPNYPHGKLFSGYTMWGPYGELHNEIPINRVPIFPRGNGSSWRIALNYLSFVLSGCLIGPFVVRKDFDVIFVYGPSPVTTALPAIFLKLFHRAPIFFWVQDLWPESLTATQRITNPFALKVITALVRFIYKHCEQVLVQSNGFYESVISKGIEKRKIKYLPNWADNYFKPIDDEKLRSSLDDLPDGFNILFAGNMGAAQSFETILSAAEKLKSNTDINWVLIGEGVMAPWLRNWLAMAITY